MTNEEITPTMFPNTHRSWWTRVWRWWRGLRGHAFNEDTLETVEIEIKGHGSVLNNSWPRDNKR